MRTDITTLLIKPGDGLVRMGAAVQLNLFAENRSGGIDLIPGNMAAWSSADVQIADVNRMGRLTPRAAGSVSITASYAGKTAAAVFNVVD